MKFGLAHRIMTNALATLGLVALLLREVGVPSRNVTGFLGGTYNAFGRFYAVRQSDAHAWVEAYIDGGWRVLDATPSAPGPASLGAHARELMEGYGLSTQVRAVAALSGSARVLGAIALTALASLLWFAYRGRTRPARGGGGWRDAGTGARDVTKHPATALYLALERALARAGIARDASRTPLKHAEDLARRGHPLAGEVAALTRLYLEARFGGRALSDTERRDFERRLRGVRAEDVS